MKKTNAIEYRDLSHGDVEVCRELCTALLAHQAAMSQVPAYKEILGSMTFENRLEPSFRGAEEKLLLVAYDGEAPIGYIFCSSEELTDPAVLTMRPDWCPADGLGFYPPVLKLPIKVADLGNLYVKPEYRGMGVGQTLTERGMAWLRQCPGVEKLFVYVSNGNNAASFYRRFGFRPSHTVGGGLIDAYWREP